MSFPSFTFSCQVVLFVRCFSFLHVVYVEVSPQTRKINERCQGILDMLHQTIPSLGRRFEIPSFDVLSYGKQLCIKLLSQ